MAKKRHYDDPGTNILRMKAWEMAPKMIAAFVLVLYDDKELNLPVEKINELVCQVAPLYERAEAEGWDIRQNCHDLTGIDCFHYMERGGKA
jgi:hypothetical protein